MEILNSFFVQPFISLGSSLAAADGIAGVVDALDSFVWGPVMIFLLLGTHVFMTIRTGFIQRKLGIGIKLSVAKDPDAKGDVSQFAALTTALAATLGTGNIVGVATAVVVGGPGAVFWMWMTGVFGIATKYAETYIAVKYRVRDHNGNMLGGAMYALERGFKRKALARVIAILFAVFAAVAAFGIGSAVQANSLAGAITSLVPAESGISAIVSIGGFETTILKIIIGIVVVILVSLVIFGGIQVISRVCEKLIPFMAIFYVLGCLIVIVMNGAFFLDAIVLIVTAAFTPTAAFGGAVGASVMIALQMGCARGLFSNESGMGSAPLVAAAATTRNPARQALVSMTGTFWDTVIVCAFTGIALVTTLLANPSMAEMYTSGAFIDNAAALTTAAFGQIPVVGPFILCVGLVLFTYSTILGWSYYGNRCVTYLFGKSAIMPYQVIYVIVAFLGTIGVSGFVWNISDMTNALMAIPNIIAVLGLSTIIARETKYYVFDGNLDEIDETEIPLFENK